MLIQPVVFAARVFRETGGLRWDTLPVITPTSMVRRATRSVAMTHRGCTRIGAPVQAHRRGSNFLTGTEVGGTPCLARSTIYAKSSAGCGRVDGPRDHPAGDRYAHSRPPHPAEDFRSGGHHYGGVSAGPERINYFFDRGMSEYALIIDLV